MNRFDGAEIKDAQAIDTSLTASPAILDDVPEADENINDFAEDSEESTASAEEFFKRYEAGESDLTGINLAGVNLVAYPLLGVST